MNAHRGKAPGQPEKTKRPTDAGVTASTHPEDARYADIQESDRRLVIPPRTTPHDDDFATTLRIVLERLPLAIAVYDAERRYRFVSDYFVSQIGVVREALVGRRDQDLFPDEVTSHYVPLLETCTKTLQPQGGEFATPREVPGLPKQLVTMAIMFVPILDEANQLIAIAALSDDVTRRANAERAAQQLAAMSRSFSYAVFTIALDGTILSWNGGAQRLYGYSGEEAIGRNLTLFTPESDQLGLRTRLRRLAAGESMDGVESTQLTKQNDSVDTCTSMAPMFNDAGAVIGATVMAHDISATKLLERRMTTASRLESVGLLTDSTAHDINNLLTIIQSYATFITEDTTGTSAKSDAEVVQTTAARGSALVSQLLSFSRKQVSHPRPLDLNNVVRGLDKLLHQAVDDRFTLIVDLDTEPVRIVADESELEQVLLSLVLYARDSLPETGQITLATRNQSVTESPRDSTPQQYGVLTVSDNGPGIDIGSAERVFDPYLVLKNGRSAGLGLATAHQLVRKSQGQMRVTSELDRGTTFIVQFRSLGQTTRPPDETTQSQAARQTILVLEEEAFLRVALRRMLQKSGFTVLDAISDEHALEVVQEHAGPIHVLVTDALTSRGSGIETARKLIAGHPEMRVLYTGRRADDMPSEPPLGRVPFASIDKPFTAEGLVAELRTLLDAPAPPAVISEPVTAPKGGTVLALIVDDQDEVRDSLQRLLAECDISTVTAKSGLHAMQRLKELPVDIVVADHFMPGMDGIKLLESIRSLYPDVVRVLYTGHASSDIVMDAINRGGVHKVLPKTMHPIAVRDHIQEIADDVMQKRGKSRGI